MLKKRSTPLIGESHKHLEVLYDGGCPICLAFVRHFSKRTSAIEVRWTPVTARSAADRSALRFEIKDNLGNSYFDTDARVLLLSAYPRYRPFARVFSQRYLRWFTEALFRVIAAYRYPISKTLAFLSLIDLPTSTCTDSCNCLTPKEK
jgi:predicted DCC family thiol-disulfide oxidoreductase YuxK